MEDVQYLVNHGEKESYMFFVDSKSRNRNMYPNPQEYAIQFSAPFKNVYSMEVLDASIPRTQYAVDEHNKTLLYIPHTQYILPGESYSELTLPIGDYTNERLIEVINEGFELNRQHDGNTMRIKNAGAEPDERSTFILTATHDFRLNVKESTLNVVLGFDMNIQTNDIGIKYNRGKVWNYIHIKDVQQETLLFKDELGYYIQTIGFPVHRIDINDNHIDKRDVIYVENGYFKNNNGSHIPHPSQNITIYVNNSFLYTLTDSKFIFESINEDSQTENTLYNNIDLINTSMHINLDEAKIVRFLFEVSDAFDFKRFYSIRFKISDIENLNSFVTNNVAEYYLYYDENSKLETTQTNFILQFRGFLSIVSNGQDATYLIDTLQKYSRDNPRTIYKNQDTSDSITYNDISGEYFEGGNYQLYINTTSNFLVSPPESGLSIRPHINLLIADIQSEADSLHTETLFYPTPTPTPSLTPNMFTPSPTPTPTFTVSPSMTETPSDTPNEKTPTPTPTFSQTHTETITNTPNEHTPTPTIYPTPTPTPTFTDTPNEPTPSPTPTFTETFTSTPQDTPTPTDPVTPTPTSTTLPFSEQGPKYTDIELRDYETVIVGGSQVALAMELIAVDPVNNIEAPGMYSLIGDRYVMLRCPEIEQHLFRSRAYEKYTMGLAKFKLAVQGYDESRFDFQAMPPREFHPIGKLTQLTLKFERPDGSLYNFRGVNHTITFALRYYQPKQTKEFTEYQLNPNYDPDYFRHQQNDTSGSDSDSD